MCADPMCEFVDCGEGRCIASNGVLGFDCECNPGWKKIRIGALTFPSCIVPNCESLSGPSSIHFLSFPGGHPGLSKYSWHLLNIF